MGKENIIANDNVLVAPVPLKGRSREIYFDLCNFIEHLPEGCSLPSLRELQRKYSAGQQTVVNALKLLDKNKQLVRIPRKKLKITKSPAKAKGFSPGYAQPPWISLPRSVNTVLAMEQSQIAIWQPVIDKFNMQSSTRIRTVSYSVNSPESFFRLKSDFVLFPTNPVLLGLVRDSSRFMDMRELVKGINQEEIFSAAFVRDPRQRLWGVAPDLGPGFISRNRQIDASPVTNDWNWEDFREYAQKVKAANPGLPYVYSSFGYINLLYHYGVSLVDAATGKVRLDPEIMSAPMEYLRDMVGKRIIPIYSDIYGTDMFHNLFSANKVAMCDSFVVRSESIARANDFDILPTPVASGCKRSIFSEMFSIMSDSMNYNTCWEFIKYMLSPEIQQQMVDLSGHFSVRKGICPKKFSTEQFVFLSNYVERCERRLEDYYIPFLSGFVIEAGIDRWIKHGGNIRSVLKDLEHSCQCHVDNALKDK